MTCEAADVAPTAAGSAEPELSARLAEVRPVAAQAAVRAGVVITEVADPAALATVDEFLRAVWQTPPTNPPVPLDVLRSVGHAGGAVHAAVDPAGSLVGAAVAVFGPPADRCAYSMVAAAAASDRGVGFAVKQAQRVWALHHGASAISWTFDPLVGRNARFNLAKLGAEAVEYLVDFYGPMDDGINAGDESDRLTARWNLLAPDPPPAGRSSPPVPAATRATHRAPDGEPLAFRTDESIWCRIPGDILAIRQADPALALAWRHAVRAVCTDALAAGFVGTSMSRDGWYHFTIRETP